MHPILASDFTGLLEIVIWFWANCIYAGVLVIAWLLLILKKTRPAGAALLKALTWAGVLLLIVVALQIQPMIFYNRRHNVDDFLTIGGVSLALFLAAYGTRYLLRRSGRQRHEQV